MARLSAENIMSTIALKNGGAVVIGGKSYIAKANRAGGFDLVETTRKALNFDKESGSLLMDDNGNVVGRIDFRGQMASEAMPELGELNATVVIADSYAKGYTLKVVKVANTNTKAQPGWAKGANIGSRQEFALYLDKA